MDLNNPYPKQADQRIIGVDLSHWQGNIDFSKLAYHNIKFAISKAGEIPTGSQTEYTDEKYQRNIAEASKNGIITGAYYYFHPAIGASRQARHFDAVMDNLGRPDLPPVIDVESNDNMEPLKVAAVLKAMIDGLMMRGWRAPIIYSRWGFLVGQVGEPYWLKDHLLWLAQYNTEFTNKPKDMSNVIIWQYTDRLRLAGIGVNIDGNYWLKSESELAALADHPLADDYVQEPPAGEPVELPEPAPESPGSQQEPPVEVPAEDPVDPAPEPPAEEPPQPAPDQPAEPVDETPVEPAPEPQPEPQPVPDPQPAGQTNMPQPPSAAYGFMWFLNQLIQAILSLFRPPSR